MSNINLIVFIILYPNPNVEAFILKSDSSSTDTMCIISVVGCCFVTYYTRKSALEAQNALHNMKILPGVGTVFICPVFLYMVIHGGSY